MARTTKAPKARRRVGMGMTRKTGYYDDPHTGKRVPYTYWQASQEVPEKALPPGLTRKRITGSGPTQKLAEERLRENYKKFQEGTPTARTKVRGTPQLTVAELFERWQRENLLGAVSEQMAYMYAGYFRNHLLPHIGKKKVQQLTEQDLLLLFNNTLPAKLNRNGKPLLSSAARRNIYNALSGCLSYGVRHGFLPRNPIRAIKAPRKIQPKDDIDTASTNARALIAKLAQEQHPDYCRWLFQFLGLRRAERLGLSWANVRGLNTDNPTIVIDQQLARHSGITESGWYIKPHTKTGSKRTIVIPEPFITALRKHKQRQDQMKKSLNWKPEREFRDLVFLQDNGAIYTLNRDNRDWNQLLKEAKLPYWRGHLNRHITATWLAEQQPAVPMGTVRAILGHDSEAMGYYYARTTQTQQTEPMRNYGKTILKATKSSSPTATRTRRRGRE